MIIKEHLNFFATLLAAAIIAVLTCWVFFRKHARDVTNNINTILSRQASVNAVIDSHKASIDAIKTKESSIHAEVDRLKSKINEVDQYSDQIDQMLNLQQDPTADDENSLSSHKPSTNPKPSEPPTRDNDQQIALVQPLEAEPQQKQDIEAEYEEPFLLDENPQKSLENALNIELEEDEGIELEPQALLQIEATRPSTQVSSPRGELLTANNFSYQEASQGASISETLIVDDPKNEMELLLLNKQNLRLERENDSLKRELEAARKEVSYLSQRSQSSQDDIRRLKDSIHLITKEEYKLRINAEKLASKLSKSLREQSRKIEDLHHLQNQTEARALQREEQLKHQLLIVGSDDIKHKIEAEKTIGKLGAGLRWQKTKNIKQNIAYKDSTDRLTKKMEGLTQSMLVIGRRDHAHRIQAEQKISKLAASYRHKNEQEKRLKQDLETQKVQLVKLDNEVLHTKEQAVLDQAQSNKTVRLMQQEIETEQKLKEASQYAIKELQAKVVDSKARNNQGYSQQKIERLKQRWSR